MIYELNFKLVYGAFMPEDAQVERVIEADASCTLYDLIFCLLNSIDFDFDHLYEFQVRKMRYSGSPMGSEGEDPSLDSIGLRKGSRFRLIYDFGDDWTFDIVVSGRREGSVERGTKVTSSIGEVEQYPDFEDWEEDYENPEDADYEALSPKAKEIADQLEEFELQLFNDDESGAADLMLEIWPKIKQYVLSLPEQAADGLVVASPVYYASANATLIACLDRLFFSTHFDKTMKVGASVVCARRGGLSATFDELNKYFTICGMPVASSQYWNSVHGNEQGQAEQDTEGLQTMRVLARNMAFLMKSIALGKEKYGLPEKEEWQPTHFIR